MNVLDAITTRYSARAFLARPVPNALVETLLLAARWAPSGANTQPWRMVVLGRVTMDAIAADILAARAQKNPEYPDYHYYPTEWRNPYRARRIACGQALYSALQIPKEDVVRRQVAWDRNYDFFGAPVGLLFFLDADLEKGSWVDMGLFLQNIMLAAKGLGLDTCPQASLADYPDIIRTVVNVPATQHLVCGMALGYADMAAAVNQYRTVREPLEDFVTWCP